MASLPGVAGGLSIALQNRIPELANISSLKSRNISAENVTDASRQSQRLDDTKAREAANKFEALLIHNMLKSMRKTTMSENKSNDRAIYDDMLDEKLADTMIKAGGLGIADRIFDQIRKQQGTPTSGSQPTADAHRLKELAGHIPRRDADKIQRNRQDSSSLVGGPSTNVSHLKLATSLWNSEHRPELTVKQREFVQPLLPHARRNASKLGTSPSAILAVAALETGWGQATIKDEHGRDSHNLFGIKASTSDNRYATTLTTEYIEGSPQKLKARFKTYESPADAVDGFSQFLLSNPRYSTALKHAGNPERFLQELQIAGYATDPRYADKAISIMRQIARNPKPL